MGEWLQEWGERPPRKVRPYWWPPSLFLRQLGSALYVGALAHWRELGRWIVTYGFKCVPGAAGSRGMGCIGFPAHPVWEMTAACNLRCIHCHASGGKPAADELTTQEAKRLLDQLAEVSEFRMMAYTGGEPLVRSDLFELLAYSQTLGFTNTMATNATLIDDAVARRLRDYGLVIAAVSLDGFDAATHDYVRGQPGSFEAALRGIRALRRAGILLHINITAMEYNVDQIEPLMALVDELGTGILLMYQLVPVGRGRGIEEAALDLGANERLIRFMAQAQRTTRAIMEPVAGPQYWPFLLQQAGIRSGPLLRLAETVFHGCSAGRGFVYIKPNGEVWPCPFIEVSCGNVRETPFSTIWATSPVFEDLREREKRLQGRCGECEYRRLCGGCRGRSWATTGNYLAEDPSCFIHASDENQDAQDATETPLQLIPLLEPIRPEMERVESLLRETLANVEEPLGSMLRRALGGGKRLRPALVVLVGQMFGSSPAPFHSLATAVDMLHAATLIHDDLLDEAPLRRGSETLHTIWPAGATVLAGDYLLGQATSLVAGLEHPRILKVFGEILCTMCAGEIRRMFVTKGKHRLRREDYYRSIEAKTASLFAASTEMAGILAGAGEMQIVALRRFGRELGMAFQIVDDVLDFIGDEAQLGKPAGSDLRQGLITLPVLCYLERAEDDTPVNTVLSGQRDEEHVRAAIEAICSSGAIEVSLAEARAHARQSQEALATLPDNASRQALCSLAEYVAERRR